MSSLNDYVKFVTQQVVLKMEQPKEIKVATNKNKKEDRLPFRYRAFGMVPLWFSMLRKKR